MHLTLHTEDGQEIFGGDSFMLGEDVESSIGEHILRVYRRHCPTVLRLTHLEEDRPEGKHTGEWRCTAELDPQTPGGDLEHVNLIAYTNPRPDPDEGYRSFVGQ